jgi:hypothetical protein
MGIGVSAAGDVWIADGSNNQLLHFPGGRIKDGRIVKVAGLKSPFDIVIDDESRVWVRNSQSDTVVRFPANDPSKVETFKAGLSVRALALDANSNVWVASNMSLDFPVPKVPDGASIMEQFRILGVAMLKYPKPTGVINMIRPDGTQLDPNGFTGNGAVNVPWGLNLDGNDDVWIGNLSPHGRSVVLNGRLGYQRAPCGHQARRCHPHIHRRQHPDAHRCGPRPSRQCLGREQLECSGGSCRRPTRLPHLDLGRRLGPHRHLRGSRPGEAAPHG